MISEQFIWFGAAVNLLAGVGYVMATVRGQARPNRVSWGLWSVTSWLAFAGQLDEGVGMPALLTLTVALIPSLIFVASFIGGAYWEVSRLDIVCGVLSVVTLVAWQLSASGIVAIVLSIAVDALAGIPTVVKAYREPESESHVAYTAGMFSAACTLLTLTEFTIATAAFAIYFLCLCGTVSFLLLVTPRLRDRALRRSLRFPMTYPLPRQATTARLRDPFAPPVYRRTDRYVAARYPVVEGVRTYRGIPHIDLEVRVRIGQFTQATDTRMVVPAGPVDLGYADAGPAGAIRPAAPGAVLDLPAPVSAPPVSEQGPARISVPAQRTGEQRVSVSVPGGSRPDGPPAGRPGAAAPRPTPGPRSSKNHPMTPHPVPPRPPATGPVPPPASSDRAPAARQESAGPPVGGPTPQASGPSRARTASTDITVRPSAAAATVRSTPDRSTPDRSTPDRPTTTHSITARSAAPPTDRHHPTGSLPRAAAPTDRLLPGAIPPQALPDRRMPTGHPSARPGRPGPTGPTGPTEEPRHIRRADRLDGVRPRYDHGLFDPRYEQGHQPVPARRSVPPGATPPPPRRGRARRVLPAATAVVAASAALAAAAYLLVDVRVVPLPDGRQVTAAVPGRGAEPQAVRAAPVGPVATSIAVPTVRGVLPVGSTPGHLALAPNGRFALIAHREAGVVSVLDTTINKITATIPVPAGPPRFVSFSPDSRRAYVSISNEAKTTNLVAVLDTTTNTLLSTVPVGRRPLASAVTPDGSRLWVPIHDDGRIDVVDTATNTVLTSIPVPPSPHWVSFSADGARAYVADHESNMVSVIDVASTATVATIPVGVSPQSTAVSAGHGQAAVTNHDSNSVSIIDEASAAVVATVPVGRTPADLDYAPDGRYLYTANLEDDTVSVVDTASHVVTATIPVCDGPTSVAATPTGRMAYVACANSGDVVMLDITADQ